MPIDLALEVALLAHHAYDVPRSLRGEWVQSRRTFLKSVAAAGALGGAARAASPINHVVVVCMENRSFDHSLGWMPSVNPKVVGSQNFVYPTPGGGSQATWYLGLDTMGCSYKDRTTRGPERASNMTAGSAMAGC
jgi:phospholipase C